jgi:hypothetical protein
MIVPFHKASDEIADAVMDAFAKLDNPPSEAWVQAVAVLRDLRRPAHIRSTAAWALGRFGVKNQLITKFLEDATKDEAGMLRRCARRALKMLKEEKMPYVYKEPEVAIQVGNVTIYHTYKEGTSKMFYHFTDLEADTDEDLNDSWFDVRKLAAFRRVQERMASSGQDSGDENVLIRWALFEAIMCGEIGELDNW